MKVILEPKVTVIAHSQFLGHPDYSIPTDGDDAVQLCAFSAKNCYASFGVDGRSNIENQKQVLEMKHGSVLEHFYITVFIEGVTRALTLELNRHRLLNISQRSTRYVAEEDSAIVLEPYYAELYKKYFIGDTSELLKNVNFVAGNEESREYQIIDRHINSSIASLNEYKVQVKLLEKINPKNLSGFDLRKWCRGKARNLLPNGLESKCVYTANLRAWRWILEVRSGEGAEPEIRRLAHHLYVALKEIAPLYFDDFSASHIVDGYPVYIPKYSKV